MEAYHITKETPILFYGAAAIGKLMFDKFSDKGFTIVGFCDKRADEIQTYMDLPVWELGKIPYSASDLVIVIAVKNVFEHDEIVKKLLSYGFDRIIFKPYLTIIGSAQPYQIKIGNCYDQILRNDIWDFSSVPIIEQWSAHGQKDYALISYKEDLVIAYIPVEFIFTNNYKDEMEKWGNVNIMAFFTHIQFFGFHFGEVYGNLDDYLNEYCVYTAKLEKSIRITERWKENVLQNRKNIFDQMELAYEIDRDFFVRNAATAEWNKRGYFNLTSGKHRTTFLAAKHCRFIPLEISKEDYEQFLRLNCVKKIKTYLSQKDDMQKIAIPHPYFYRDMLQDDLYTHRFVERIFYFLGKQLYLKKGKVDFSNLCVLDANGYDGYMGRYLKLSGCEVYRINTGDNELVMLLDELAGVRIDAFNYDLPQSEFNVVLYNFDLEDALEVSMSNMRSDYYILTGKSGRRVKKENMEIVDKFSISHNGQLITTFICQKFFYS